METGAQILQFVRRVMPNASEAELREATANFDEYMAVVWDIFQRIKRQQDATDSPNEGHRSTLDNDDQIV